MIAFEKTVKKEEIFTGRVLKFDVDTVELPDGSLAGRELVFHPGGVGVVAIDTDGFVYMIRQFRKPYEKVILEIPAGKLERGENPEDAAKRELMEETGVCSDSLISLGKFYPSVGYTNEVLHMFLAKDLCIGEAKPDDDEYVETEKIHISELKNMIMSGEIKDGKTIAAVLKAAILIESE